MDTRDGYRVEKRSTSPGESVKVRCPCSFKRLFKEKIIVRGEDLNGMTACSAANPRDEFCVSVAIQGKLNSHYLANARANRLAERSIACAVESVYHNGVQSRFHHPNSGKDR